MVKRSLIVFFIFIGAVLFGSYLALTASHGTEVVVTQKVLTEAKPQDQQVLLVKDVKLLKDEVFKLQQEVKSLKDQLKQVSQHVSAQQAGISELNDRFSFLEAYIVAKAF